MTDDHLNPWERVEFQCGYSPLMLACSLPSENDSIVKFLVEAKSDVNSQNEYGVTALMLAGMQGKVESVKYLLAAGADPDRTTRCGNNVLTLTIMANNAISNQPQDSCRSNSERAPAYFDAMQHDPTVSNEQTL
jgi:ankyrin repeat protein